MCDDCAQSRSVSSQYLIVYTIKADKEEGAILLRARLLA